MSLSLSFFYFMFYSFLGWLLEEAFEVLRKGSFKKDSFLYGPFKPMYGLCSLLLLGASVTFPLPFFIFLAILLPTLIEYITGYLFLFFFHKRYWNYHLEPCNLQGIICLRFSLLWGFLSGFFIKSIHPFLSLYLEPFYPLIIIIVPLLFIYFLIDLFFTLKGKTPSALL